MVEYLRGTEPHFIDVFEPSFQYVMRTWKPKHKIAFVTVCSWAKPYSHSYIHKTIRSKLQRDDLLKHVDYIHLSSAGVIPDEYETMYPFCAYDYDTKYATERDLAYLRKTIARRFTEFFLQDNIYYPHVAMYFRPWSNTAQAIRPILEKHSRKESFHFLWEHRHMPQTKDGVERVFADSLRWIQSGVLLPDPDDALLIPVILGKAMSALGKIACVDTGGSVADLVTIDEGGNVEKSG